jgi:hypothetical protein
LEVDDKTYFNDFILSKEEWRMLGQEDKDNIVPVKYIAPTPSENPTKGPCYMNLKKSSLCKATRLFLFFIDVFYVGF